MICLVSLNGLLGMRCMWTNALQRFTTRSIGFILRQRMTSSIFSYDDEACQTQMIDDPSDKDSQFPPTPGNFGRTPGTSSSLSPTPDPTFLQTQARCLEFLPFNEWERREENSYQNEPRESEFIRYTLAWKLKFNRSTEARETEKDLVVAPSEYWDRCLKQKVEQLVHTKKRNRRVRSEDTAIVVSIKHRNEESLEKLYGSTNIDWRPVERQLRKWSNLVRTGRTPHVAITFQYIRDDDTSDKRGSSATKRMLAERDTVILAEERSDQPSTWRYVYKLMRCSVSSCDNFEKWCWQDPEGRRHYTLRKPHLEKLCAHVKAEGKLDSHHDVPEDVRQALYMEAQQKFERSSNKTNKQIAAGVPCPINIINCLPTQSARGSPTSMSAAIPAPPSKRLKISGPRDDAVKEYCEWHVLQVTDERRKADWRKACDITLSNGLDLEIVDEDQEHVQFLIERGVTKGTAWRFVRDIHEWAERAIGDLPPEPLIQGPANDRDN